MLCECAPQILEGRCHRAARQAQKEKIEPVWSTRQLRGGEAMRAFFRVAKKWWAHSDLNRGPNDYEERTEVSSSVASGRNKAP